MTKNKYEWKSCLTNPNPNSNPNPGWITFKLNCAWKLNNQDSGFRIQDSGFRIQDSRTKPRISPWFLSSRAIYHLSSTAPQYIWRETSTRFNDTILTHSKTFRDAFKDDSDAFNDCADASSKWRFRRVQWLCGRIFKMRWKSRNIGSFGGLRRFSVVLVVWGLWAVPGPETGGSTRQSLTGPRAKGSQKGGPEG